MKSHRELPGGYREILRIDLQKNKKLALLVNGLAVLIALVMVALVPVLMPGALGTLLSGGLGIFLKLIVLYAGMFLYFVLHELVHGIFMARFSDAKVRYGFTGLYAYAGSDAYYCRKHYVIIALAPVVVWGVVLAILYGIVPKDWALVVYLIQIINLSGAAGDLYVSWKMNRLPADILIQDTGVAMTVYSAEEGFR